MKILNSLIFDKINSVFAFCQSKTDLLRQNSFLLSGIDFFILLSIIMTYVVSTFAETNLTGFAAVFVPVFVFVKFITTKGEKLELEKCNFYLLIYLLICLISNFTSSMPASSFYGFTKTLLYLGFYFALCQFLKNKKQYIPILLGTIAILVCFESLIGLIQNTMRLENISTWQDVSYLNPEDILSRVYGTLKPYNPNLLGGYLIAGISSILGFSCLFLHCKKYKMAAGAIFCFFISAFTIFLTGCRGAYLALFIIFIGIVLASYHFIFKFINIDKLKLLWTKTLMIFIICSAGFLVFNHKILQRIMSVFLLRGDSSTSFRINVYHSAIQMLQDNFVFGIGVGNKVFREIYGLYMLSGFDALSCYCIFLEMAVESGVFALFAYLLFLFSLIKSGIQVFISSKDFNQKILIFTSLISIIAVMFHGLFDTIYFRPQVQFIFWTMTAILTVLVREGETINNENT